MSEQGIHYRQGGKLTHCGCEILPNGNDIEYIVIKNIDLKGKEFIGGRDEKDVWIANFHENPYTKLPMVLNATNRKRLAKLAKNPMINLIKDFPVRLTQEECRDAQDGGTTWGLRISKLPANKAMVANNPTAKANTKSPAVLQVMTEDRIESAVQYLKDHSMEELQQFYTIPDNIKIMIENARKGA